MEALKRINDFKKGILIGAAWGIVGITYLTLPRYDLGFLGLVLYYFRRIIGLPIGIAFILLRPESPESKWPQIYFLSVFVGILLGVLIESFAKKSNQAKKIMIYGILIVILPFSWALTFILIVTFLSSPKLKPRMREAIGTILGLIWGLLSILGMIASGTPHYAYTPSLTRKISLLPAYLVSYLLQLLWDSPIQGVIEFLFFLSPILLGGLLGYSIIKIYHKVKM